MSLRPRIFVLSQVPVLLVVCLALSGCHSQAASAPTISVDRIPAADQGGPNKLGSIEGRVTGARPGQQIVLYARSADNVWWIQPFADRPFTKIQGDFKWKNVTHLGTDYAVLLVAQGYRPSDTTEELPGPGAGIIAEALVKGRGPAPPEIPIRRLSFSGYDWIIRTGNSFRGGAGNSFAPENAWTDKSGALHLRISRRNNDWNCAEIRLTRSLGYGTYRFKVRDVSQLEPSAVLSMFDWDGAGTEQNRRELDIEIGRWGYRDADNAQYVVQPYYIPVNIVRFRVPAGVLTHTLRWEPGQATFSTTAGDTLMGHVINQHVFTSGVPAPGGDSVRVSLYAFGKGQIPLNKETEIVVEKFEYLP
jgi:hypothetical protein